MKREANDDEPIRSPWELERDKQMNSQVENYNVISNKYDPLKKLISVIDWGSRNLAT